MSSNHISSLLPFSYFQIPLGGYLQGQFFFSDQLRITRFTQATELSSIKAGLLFNCCEFSLSYRPGSENVRSDSPSHPKGIVSSASAIGAVTWELEHKVKHSHDENYAPSAFHFDHMFIHATLRPQVLQWGHSSCLAFHPGVICTAVLLQQHFWWSSMEDIKGFTTACQICSQH